MKHISRLLVTGLAAAALLASPSALRAQSSAQPDQFRVGDRIALIVEGPTTIFDTVLVREGLLLRLPNMEDISLRGVRRADTQKYLTEQIGKYIKGATVHATPLIQLAVLGAVARPGYISIPTDILLTDALMRAGGPGATAQMDKVVIRRDGHDVYGQQDVARALANGSTVEGLGLMSGDQLVVPEKPTSGHLDTFLKIFGTVLAVAGLALAVAAR